MQWGSNNPNPKRSPGGRPWPRGLEIALERGESGDGIDDDCSSQGSSPETTCREPHFGASGAHAESTTTPRAPSLVTLSTRGTAIKTPSVPPGLLSPEAVKYETPPEYVCPLTRRVMEDPAVAADGRSYERRPLEDWLRGGRNDSPATGEPLEHTLVVPNANLRAAIQRWAEAHPSPSKPRPVSAELRGAPAAPKSPQRRAVAPPPDRVRFSATPTRLGRDAGTVDWFVSKSGGQGYGAVRVDGARPGEELVTIRETSLGGVVLAAGDRVAFCHATVGNEVRAVDVELLPETVQRVQARSSLAGARGVTPRAPDSPRLRSPAARPVATPRPGGRTPKGERITGTCTWFSENYGFLRPDNGQPDVFVHSSAAPGGSLRKDDRCEFRIATYNDRARAVDVELILDRGFSHGPIGGPSPRSWPGGPAPPSPRRSMGGFELAAHETKPFAPPRGFFGGDGAF